MSSTTFNNVMALSSEYPEATQLSAKNRAQNLAEAKINQEYIIKDVVAVDDEIVNFLFTLGCFKGEPITVISVLSESYVINIKDARYSIGSELAQAVIV